MTLWDDGYIEQLRDKAPLASARKLAELLLLQRSVSRELDKKLRKYRLMARSMSRLIPKSDEAILDFQRVDGDVTCNLCGLSWFYHPDAPEGGGSFRIACDGKRLKL